MTNLAVVYYSSTGTNAKMAHAVAEGAKASGADVRVLRIAETAPAAAIASNPKWKEFVDSVASEPVATASDLEWADAIVFGTPTRFGNVASQFKAFIDSLGGLWFQGKLANKVYSAFTSAMNPHGGQESTLLALYNTIYHFGGIIVTPGYTDPCVFAAGGNPYGASATANGEHFPSDAELAHARYQGKRVAEFAKKISG